MNKHEFKDRIRELIEKHKKEGPLFLVFHDASQDVKSAVLYIEVPCDKGSLVPIYCRYLKGDGLKAIERIEHVLPDNPVTGEIYVVDTVDLFAALEGDSSNQSRSLDRVCKHLQIQTSFLHNAGNDAYVSTLSSNCCPKRCNAHRL